MRTPLTVLAVTAAALAAAVPATQFHTSPGHAVRAAAIEPYVRPPFHCRVHHFGEGEAPDPTKQYGDPLCVDYDKRDITADNGGAVAFLLAEPARFAIAVPVCRYWQTDHWSVQIDRADAPIVTWDGSYWFDKTRAAGAVHLANFAIAGQPVGAAQAAAAVATVSPALADQIRRYGPGGHGDSGVAFVPGESGLPCQSGG